MLPVVQPDVMLVDMVMPGVSGTVNAMDQYPKT
jgi:hypothetical protein